MMTQVDLVKAGDLAGTYTGVLEAVRVNNLDDLGDSQREVLVDIDLLHTLTVREIGPMTVRIESPVIPPLRATVLGHGPVAIDAEFIAFDANFTGLKVKQIVFVQYEGEWIVVLQLVQLDQLQPSVDGIGVYQYVSYPTRVAARLNEEEAIRYVNAILKLI